MSTRPGRGYLHLVRTVVALVVGWFVSGILVFALIAGDYERPEDAPDGWVEALQRVIAAIWLFSPLIVVGLLLVRRHRRRQPRGDQR